MRLVIIFFFFAVSIASQAQPNTEIYLFDLTYSRGQYTIGSPTSISMGNPGYDNQPFFSPEGNFLYYVATRNGQTDIVAVSMEGESRNWVSDTPNGGEYSPKLSPGKKFISAVQLETSGRQLLWKYDQNNDESQILIQDAKIGYYAWSSPSKLAAFVLGEPNTLQLFDLKNNNSKIITEQIGRSLHKIPGSNKISFISKKEEEWKIYSLDPKNGKTKLITCSLTGSEDMAWTKEKRIIMGKEGKLFSKHPKKDENWKEIISFTEFGYKNVSRIAISPDGTKIAIVVDE